MCGACRMTDERRIIGREPFEVLEIDQDFCANSYGVAPCTADINVGGKRCFNTRQTCQDPENYALDVLTLRFCSDRVSVPLDGNYYFPFLQSVKVTPGSINPGGGNQSSTALGTRAKISVTFQDRPHTDRYVDPYVEDRKADDPDYNPYEQGTFWTKWRARNPFYLNRIMRYRSGYIRDGQIVDEVTRTFIITGFSGPTADGTVTITGRDILTRVQNKKAQAPVSSLGKLVAAIDTTATSATLVPAGVGDLPPSSGGYPAAGTVRINNETMEFTRVGDVLTFTNRASDGTELADHDEGDTVQLCLRYDGESPPDIVNDLLTNYAGIDPSFIPLADWQAEAATYIQRLYSALITEPTGVDKLVAEMCDQMFFYIWTDERASQIRFRAVRPAEGETVYQLDADANIVEDSTNFTDQADQLLTRVVVNYALRDPTQKLNEKSNYAATDLIDDPDSASRNKNDGVRTKTVNSRWITGANGAAAIELGDKLLSRYGNIPQKVTFTLDAKDREIWVGDFVQVSDRRAVDDLGQPIPVNVQVTQAQESRQGSRFSYTGQTFIQETPPDPTDKTIIISSDQWNLNLRDVYDSQFGTPPEPGDVITVIIRSNVTIGGRINDATVRDGFISDFVQSQVGGADIVLGQTLVMPIFEQTNSRNSYGELIRYVPAGGLTPVEFPLFDPTVFGFSITEIRGYGAPVSLRTGDWPNGVTLNLTVEPGAQIMGAGGYGSLATVLASEFAGSYLPPYVHYCSDGGHAIDAEVDININNLGTIAGGGAGGVGWSYISASSASGSHSLNGGGGAGSGPAGTTTNAKIAGTRPVVSVQEPAPGSLVGPGQGGIYFIDNTGTDNTIETTEGGGFGVDRVDFPGGGQITSTIEGTGNHRYGIEIPLAPENPLSGFGGYAVFRGVSKINWINKGNVIGPEKN